MLNNIVAIVALTWLIPSTATPLQKEASIDAKVFSAEDCVEHALQSNAQIQEAQAKVAQWQARLKQVESLYYPKLMGLAYLAPMFTVHGNAVDGVERRWKSYRDWGPYTHLEAILAQPIYSFGRIAAGKDAAKHRVEVEKAQVRATEHLVAREVKNYYYLHLFAKSLIPALNNASEILVTAREKADEIYDAGTGEVTQADLMKLEYGKSEIEKYLLLAKNGADLALGALKHTIGLPYTTPLALKDKKLPRAKLKNMASLAELLVESANNRPEWLQLSHGEQAALSLEKAETLANWPVVFLGGNFRFDWAPTRTDTNNPYHMDEYNNLYGGLALGLKFDVDPALASAKADEAKALGKEVEALKQFARSGIPLQVRKAHQEVTQATQLAKISKRGEKAARKWMTFSAAAYATGTGEAKDVLEGLVAYLQAKRSYYESLLNFHVGLADLSLALGKK